MKNINVAGNKMARNGRKTAIYASRKFDAPPSIICCINFSARCTKFMGNVSLVLRDPIASIHVASTLVLDVQNLWQM